MQNFRLLLSVISIYSLSLEEAISHALEENLELKHSSNNKKISNINYRDSFSPFLPQVSLSGSYSRNIDRMSKKSFDNLNTSYLRSTSTKRTTKTGDLNSRISLSQLIFSAPDYYNLRISKKDNEIANLEYAKKKEDYSLSNMELEMSNYLWKSLDYRYPSDIAKEILYLSYFH